MKSKVSLTASSRVLTLADAVLGRTYMPRGLADPKIVAVMVTSQADTENECHLVWFCSDGDPVVGCLSEARAFAFEIIPFEEGDQFIQTF